MTAFEGVREHPDGGVVMLGEYLAALADQIDAQQCHGWFTPIAHEPSYNLGLSTASKLIRAAAVRVVAAPTEEER